MRDARGRGVLVLAVSLVASLASDAVSRTPAPVSQERSTRIATTRGVVPVVATSRPSAAPRSPGATPPARIATADTVVLFGPATYAVTPGGGAWSPHAADFAATPLAAGRRGVLRIENGGAGGGNRASGVLANWNGAQVVGSRELDRSVGGIAPAVPIAASNSLRLWVAGSVGDYVTVTVLSVPDSSFELGTPLALTRGAGVPLITTQWLDLPAGATGTFEARIVNGTGDTKNRAADLRLRVNGVEALLSHEVNGGVARLVRPVWLAGQNRIEARISGATGATATIRFAATDSAPPVLVVSAPAEGAVTSATTIDVTGTVTDLTPVTLTVNGAPVTVAPNGTFTANVALSLGSNTLTMVASDAVGRASTVMRHVTRESAPPPLVAPPLDTTGVTPFRDRIAFLYTGPSPVQTGVALGTITERRAAVVRGRVLQRDGAPLANAAVTVLDHPELGQTLSRADGRYDLAVNGGGRLTLAMNKAGFLGAQRSIETPWRDFAAAPDVALVPLDPEVTAIQFVDPIEVARGSVVSDSSGTRRATMMFAQGTVATVVRPDSSSEIVGTAHVRATEYTVGPNGALAMPGELPPMSGYTYCAELSLDEGLAVGARRVQFSQPVAFYLENFLGFPVGTIVPVGAYDRATGLWYAEPNGRVVRVLAATAGVANVDTDGDSLADSTPSLDSLGLDTNERQQLATLYSPGQTLWRAELSHFSPIDCNYPSGPPATATPPNADPVRNENAKDCNGQQSRSIIECENQVLGERLAVTGTPFTLNYRSDRSPGHLAARELILPVTSAGTSPLLKRATVTIRVAGQEYRQDFLAPGPGQVVTYVWDGRDAYGREVQGEQKAWIRTDFVYPLLYRQPASVARSFGLACYGSAGGGLLACELPADFPDYASRETGLTSEQTVTLGGVRYQPMGLGGWSLDVHHFYDRSDEGTLYAGDGSRRRGGQLSPVLYEYAGNATVGFSGDGGKATAAQLSRPSGLALAPDGTLYIAETDNHRVRAVSPDGIISTVAGTGTAGSGGDGGPAALGQLDSPRNVAVGRDGSLYIADTGNHRIRRVAPGGMLSTFAGTGTAGHSGDGGFAAAAQLDAPRGLIVTRDGSVVFADQGSHRVRRVDAQGMIATLAGTGVPGSSGDGAAAFQARLSSPLDVAEGRGGELYVADYDNHKVRRIGLDGVIETVAGTGVNGLGGDGGPATDANLDGPSGVVVGADGILYVSEFVSGFVRAVDASGIIRRVAGAGSLIKGLESGPENISARPRPWRPRVQSGPAAAVVLSEPIGLAVSPDGVLYVAESQGQQVHALRSALPGFAAGEIAVASGDAREVYAFDARGRHLRTVDTRTGVVSYRFGYTPAGLIESITDRDGNATTIERDGTGQPTGIVGPYGQRTAVTLNAGGYLASLTNPAGEVTALGYQTGGLLNSFTNPRGATSSFGYDPLGRLLTDEDATGAEVTLARTLTDSSRTVTFTSGEGRETRYRVVESSDGTEVRSTTDAANLVSTSRRGTDDVTRTTSPDGTTTRSELEPDPRFGMEAPALGELRIETPSSLEMTTREIREVQFSDPADSTRATLIRTTLKINAIADYVEEWDADTRTITSQTPEGRSTVTELDTLGRVVRVTVPGLSPVDYAYDARGRLETSTQGGRLWGYAYDASGRLERVTDPLLRENEFRYDAADRLVRQILPDLREVTYAYDSTGNLASLTPPGRPAHRFGYTPLDLTERYGPPGVGLDSTGTHYAYDDDRALLTITRPDSAEVTLGYDAAGRLETVTEPRGARTFGYSPTSGNLTSLTSPDGVTLAYAYDGGLPLSETWSGAITGLVALAYDDRFRPESQTVNAEPAVPFGYDYDGLLVQAGALTLERSPDNGLLAATTLDQVTTSQSYNGAGELAAFEAKHGATSLFATGYGRDSLGRITSLTETVLGSSRTLAYEYDLAGRLERVRENGTPVQTYTYDPNGNRLTFVGATAGDTASALYDDQDRLLRYGNTRYFYGANGELRLAAAGADTTRYTYDALGNLVTVKLPNADRLDYLVDGQNRRVGKKLNGVLVQGWLYQNGLNPIAELDGAGAITAQYVYGSRGHVPDYVMKGGTTYRLVTDHLGSVRLVVDAATGAIAERREYDAWGRVVLDTNPGFVSVGYAGGLWEPMTGLVRFGARDYEARVGRWTAKDPAGFEASTNSYSYAANVPTLAIDLSGRSPVLLAALVAALVTLSLNPDVANAPGPHELVLDSNGGLQIAGDVALSAVLGPLFAKLGRPLESMLCRLPIAQRSLRHLAKHLPEFQALDPAFSEEDMLRLASRIARDPANLARFKGGNAIYEATARVGDQAVPVRVVVNVEGRLRTVFIVRH